MKSKQSYNNGKHFVLPQLKNYQSNRFTSRHKVNNRSLPKITANYAEQIDQSSIQSNSKQVHQDKKPLKDKLKSIYKKKKNYLLLNSRENETTSNEIDEAYVTSQFQKEIQKNLMLIKKEKQTKKNGNINKKLRYNSPRLEIKTSDEVTQGNKFRCATEEDVFTKINEIIMNSQSKSALLVDNNRNISFSAFVKNQKPNQKEPLKHNSRKKIKTEPQEMQNSESSIAQVISHHPFKHAGNYNQWRKLSIDSSGEGRIKYDVSSYQMQTDRLQKIRSKNDLSLKKYFEGKNYLSKIMNYRNSSSLLSKKD